MYWSKTRELFNKTTGDLKMTTTNKLRSTLGFEEEALPNIEHVLDDRLNLTMLEAIDEALSFLGESAKRAIYYHLEEKFKIRREEIPLRIDDFAEAIEEIFGMGAKIIEIQIMKSLYKKIGCNFKYVPKEKNLLFTAYLKALRNHFRKLRNVK